MPILFTIISHQRTPLVKCASCPGNFMEVVEQILPKIGAEQPRMTYSHGQFLFHYVVDAGTVVLCITDDAFDRSQAFAFLAEVKKRFTSVYGYRLGSAAPYAMNCEFSPLLASEMRRFSESRAKLVKAQSELDDLKAIMVKNIDSIASRGERLELLVNKADNLSANSVTFRANTRNVARTMWWRNVKFMVLCSVGALLTLYLVVSFACGGLDWNKCVGK